MLLKTLALALLVPTVIVGCVYIVSDSRTMGVIPSTCTNDPVIQWEPIPDVPSLTDKELANGELADTILVNKIKELRDYSKRMQALADARYASHCR